MALHTKSGKRRLSFGFTLIELLVVMAIIGTLLTIAGPRYLRSLEQSKEVVLTQDLAILRDALDQFYGDRGHFPESLQELAAERYIRQVPVDPLTKSADTWEVLQSTDSDIDGIADVRSGSDRISRDGIPFNEF